MYRCKETDAFRRRCSSKWMHHSAAFFDGDVTWERGKTHWVAVARLVSSKSCPVSVFMHRNLPCLYHFWSLAKDSIWVKQLKLTSLWCSLSGFHMTLTLFKRILNQQPAWECRRPKLPKRPQLAQRLPRKRRKRLDCGCRHGQFGDGFGVARSA